jgi:hypothetical protein
MVRRPDLARSLFKLDPSRLLSDLMVLIYGAKNEAFKDFLSIPPKVWGAEILSPYLGRILT